MDHNISLADGLGVLRRRRALIAGITAIGIALAIVVALILPRSYEAQAIIQIELPNISEQTTPPTTSVGAQAKYRLTLIEQQLMARDSLLGIVDELGLFAGQGLSDTKKVEAMRRSATIEQIVEQSEAWRPDVVPSGLRITVQLGDARQSADTANLFLSRILTQAEARRAEQASAALNFFESEEARVGAKITALEAEIAEYKTANSAILPEGLMTLRTQLAALKQTQLDIERDLVALRANAARVREDLLAGQIGELEKQAGLVNERVAGLEALLLAAPQVERELNLLHLELDKLQEQYSVIARRGAEAEMGQMLQTSEQTERFEVLEQALVPEYPVAPSRKKIVAAGAFLAFVAGAALALLLEARKPTIHTAIQLERALGVSPIVSIPMIEGKNQKRGRRGGLILMLVAVIVGAVTALWPVVRDFIGRMIVSLSDARRGVGKAASRVSGPQTARPGGARG